MFKYSENTCTFLSSLLIIKLKTAAYEFCAIIVYDISLNIIFTMYGDFKCMLVWLTILKAFSSYMYSVLLSFVGSVQ